jgi:uncharacterized protein DUF6190
LKAYKEFFDASVFLGMHSVDDEVRKACKNFFASRFLDMALTSLDQVGKCDDVIWRYPRHLQDAYYPFMDRLHSEMRIVREPFSEAELKRAYADPSLQGLPAGDRLLLAKVIEAGGYLYSIRPYLTGRSDLPVCNPGIGPEADFPAGVAGLYHISLLLLIPVEEIQE